MFLIPTALAAPKFLSPDPALARLADAAWAAATACIGFEAAAHSRVRIEVGPVRGGFGGRAHSDGVVNDASGRDGASSKGEAGLYLIELSSPRPRTLAHEVAHAWVSGGPPALVEGAADLLADCIVGLAPLQFGWDMRSDTLEGLVDLRAWANEDDANPSERSAGYAAAHRLMRAAARVVPEGKLWRSAWTWDEFASLLKDAGDAAVIPAVEGGVMSQRAALVDQDGDGLSLVEEHLVGTDPDVWDTDRDGWWDGAPVRLRTSGAVPVPPDGTPTCTGRASGSFGAAARLVVGSGMRVWIDGEPSETRLDRTFLTRPGASIATSSGGAESLVSVRGIGLIEDRRCYSDAVGTIFATEKEQARLPALSLAFSEAAARASTLLGPETARVVIHLRTRPSRSEGDHVYVQAFWGLNASNEAIVALAIAETRLRNSAFSGHEAVDPPVIRALARAIVPKEGDEVLPGDEQVEHWEHVVASCAEGWRGLLDGHCVP